MAARYSCPTSSQSGAQATKNTRNYLEEDFLFLPTDPGGSDSESDPEVDDSPAEPKSWPQPTTVMEEKPANTRSGSGLKIVIPARKRGSAVIARRNVGDDFADLDEEDDDDLEYEADEEEEEEPPVSPAKHRKIEYRGARSPLSASSNVSVYAGHRCTINNCNFTATTAQHLRHHIATAQHSRSLRSAYGGAG